MYTVAVRRDFSAQHFLVGDDWGEENKPHTHHYIVEIKLEGPDLDANGYLLDICDIESVLATQVGKYEDKILNNLTEFKNINPSLEHFARILCKTITAQIQTSNLSAIAIKIWENEMAWAEFHEKL